MSRVGGGQADALSGDGEALVEAYWRTPIGDNVVLQPAIMSVVSPAGVPDADDALILGLPAILSW